MGEHHIEDWPLERIWTANIGPIFAGYNAALARRRSQQRYGRQFYNEHVGKHRCLVGDGDPFASRRCGIRPHLWFYGGGFVLHRHNGSVIRAKDGRNRETNP